MTILIVRVVLQAYPQVCLTLQFDETEFDLQAQGKVTAVWPLLTLFARLVDQTRNMMLHQAKKKKFGYKYFVAIYSCSP
eukprot:5403356-Amphidinium_carterae.1